MRTQAVVIVVTGVPSEGERGREGGRGGEGGKDHEGD